jgi:hypothetical protein
LGSEEGNVGEDTMGSSVAVVAVTALLSISGAQAEITDGVLRIGGLNDQSSFYADAAGAGMEIDDAVYLAALLDVANSYIASAFPAWLLKPIEASTALDVQRNSGVCHDGWEPSTKQGVAL